MMGDEIVMREHRDGEEIWDIGIGGHQQTAAMFLFQLEAKRTIGDDGLGLA